MTTRALARALCLLAATWLASPASARPPAEEYLLHCAGCHGLDGGGVPALAPTLHGLAELADAPRGRAYLARVPGVAQAPVSDGELAALLNWVVEAFSGASLVPPYISDEVGALRSDPLRDPAAMRRLVVGARPPDASAHRASAHPPDNP